MPHYDKHTPFKASLKARRLLTGTESSKKTFHLEIDLAGSGISYSVGDSLAVLPKNPPATIEPLLKLFKDKQSAVVKTRHIPDGIDFKTFLEEKANVSSLTKKLVQAVLSSCSETEKQALLEISGIEHSETSDQWKTFCETHHVLDFLQEYMKVEIDPQVVAEALQPLLPRFYSIASSQKAVGDEVHLTIATVAYHAGDVPRVGICTHYLCEKLDIGEKVAVYLQPHHGFTLPTDPSIPLIMIGPGTGVAPFRAFMQERALLSTSGPHWLFFGERNSSSDFLYEKEWHALEKSGKLRLDTAFSRDQADKIYVQHKMLENSLEIWKWIEQGAYFFVCGDASQMAKDVERTLLEIIEKEGGFTDQEAKDYLKKLRQQKRYLKDVY